jgi:hypothetical protein
MRSDPLCMSLIFIEQAGHEAGFSGAVCTEHVKAFSHFQRNSCRRGVSGWDIELKMARHLVQGPAYDPLSYLCESPLVFIG